MRALLDTHALFVDGKPAQVHGRQQYFAGNTVVNHATTNPTEFISILFGTDVARLRWM